MGTRAAPRKHCICRQGHALSCLFKFQGGQRASCFQAHQCPGSSATFSNPGKKNCGRFGLALFFWGFMFGFKLGAVQHALTQLFSPRLSKKAQAPRKPAKAHGHRPRLAAARSPTSRGCWGGLGWQQRRRQLRISCRDCQFLDLRQILGSRRSNSCFSVKVVQVVMFGLQTRILAPKNLSGHMESAAPFPALKGARAKG